MIKKILSPIQKFVKTESLAGLLLFGATIIALIWANSSFSDSYQKIWQYKVGFSFQNFELNKPLILWINDGLMAIFFFLIGLELKRELLIGEINSIKKASFPIIAALGGIIIPIALYLILNQNPETTKGWGIPMATDIAFALAILSLLGNRIPLSLKIFLTAFAIIDDLAAVIVIAIFYSDNINWMLLIFGISLIIVLALFYRYKKYSQAIGIIFAVVIWILFLKSGIHPTIAGVLLAFTIPIKRKLDVQLFSQNLSDIASKIDKITKSKAQHLLSKKEIEYINELDELSCKVRSPLQHLEHKLHGLTALLILPIFAFANAGVKIDTSINYDLDLLKNIAISLLFGKFLGVFLFSYIGLKLKWLEFPKGIKLKQVIGIAAIAGVGFTMSIFIDNLAFKDNLIYIDSAKIGIIIGSLLSGILGYSILRFTNKPTQKNG